MVQRVCQILLSLCFLALCVSALRAQHQSRGYISAETNLVRIQVIVFDDKGVMANGLTKADFRVLDDGQEQRIQYFSHARQPASFVLSLDDSQSMQNKIPFVREAAFSLLTPFPDVKGQKNFRDEFSLIRFANRAEVVAPFAEGATLQPRIDDLIQPTESATALFDSVYLAIATEQDALNKRRAIIVVTDGGDNHSRYSLRETKRFLEEADVPLFAVVAGASLRFPVLPSAQDKSKSKLPMSPIIALLESNVDTERLDDFIGPAELRGPHNLKVLSETTGGAVFTALRLEDLQRIVRTIGIAVRYSYLIGYQPPSPEGTAHPKASDGWHKVSVQLVPPEKYPGYVMYAKRRYYDSGALSRRP